MTPELSYVYLNDKYEIQFTKHDRTAERVPVKGEVLNLKHIKEKTITDYVGEVLLVVETKSLYGFPNFDDCSVQRSKTTVYLRKLNVSSMGEDAHLILLDAVMRNELKQYQQPTMEVLKAEPIVQPKIEIFLNPTVYADNKLEITPEVKHVPHYSEISKKPLPPVPSIYNERDVFTTVDNTLTLEAKKDDQVRSSQHKYVITRLGIRDILKSANLAINTFIKIRKRLDTITIQPELELTKSQITNLFKVAMNEAKCRSNVKDKVFNSLERFFIEKELNNK